MDQDKFYEEPGKITPEALEELKKKTKPTLCLDFDGVIHSYASGWRGATVILDPPVDGAIDFIHRALDHFAVCVYSSRSGHPDGIYAMSKWLRRHWLEAGLPDRLSEISWPTEKPAAFVTIDDRALTFSGAWPSIEYLKNFRPWNKRPRRDPDWRNEISDLCMTAVVTDQMTIDQVVGYYADRLNKIYDLLPVASAVMRGQT